MDLCRILLTREPSNWSSHFFFSMCAVWHSRLYHLGTSVRTSPFTPHFPITRHTPRPSPSKNPNARASHDFLVRRLHPSRHVLYKREQNKTMRAKPNVEWLPQEARACRGFVVTAQPRTPTSPLPCVITYYLFATFSSSGSTCVLLSCTNRVRTGCPIFYCHQLSCAPPGYPRVRSTPYRPHVSA